MGIPLVTQSYTILEKDSMERKNNPSFYAGLTDAVT